MLQLYKESYINLKFILKVDRKKEKAESKKVGDRKRK